jgi:hypothetical protein
VVTDGQRRLVYALAKAHVFRPEIGLFRTVQIIPRWGFRWVLEWLLRNQTVDNLHHAPCCPANHFCKRRLVFTRCNCGAAARAQQHAEGGSNG